MKPKTLTVPEIILIAGTRVALGAGIGFLLGNKLDDDQRTAAGIALLAVGLLSTIPLALDVLSKKNGERSSWSLSEEPARHAVAI